MSLRTVRILNTTGLHARSAGLFVDTANRFRSTVRVTKGAQEVDGKSLLSLLLLEATHGTELTIKAEGEDEAEALEALVTLVEARFEERGTEETSKTVIIRNS